MVEAGQVGFDCVRMEVQKEWAQVTYCQQIGRVRGGFMTKRITTKRIKRQKV
jgi:hypothetical protein